MGGSYVTIENGVITIPNVTGSIVISGEAVAIDTGEPTNFAVTNSSNKTDISIWCNDARLGSDFTYRAQAGRIITNFIEMQAGDIIYVKGITFDIESTSMVQSLSFYDSTKTGKSISAPGYYVGSNGYITLTSDDTYELIMDTKNIETCTNCIGAEWMRIVGSLTGTLDDVVINIKRNGVWR